MDHKPPASQKGAFRPAVGAVGAVVFGAISVGQRCHDEVLGCWGCDDHDGCN